MLVFPFSSYAILWQISKALLARNSSDVMRFVDRFFELLGDENIGWDAGRVIGEIAGTDEVLTKENHASIKVKWSAITLGELF